MNSQYTYFLILAASFAGPVLLSFDRKVAFYKKWKYVFPAMILPAIFYIAWDIYFTAKGVWSFNEQYITGHKLVNLPIEEVLFFFIVPYSCVFIYACIRAYFPLLKDKPIGSHILKGLGLALLLAGLYYHNRDYTSWTFILNAAFIASLFLFRKYFRDFDPVSFLVSYAICLVPFFIVNGFLTSLPVVMYNDMENTGFRLYTIPFEDTFYGMLLVMMNVAIYEKLGSR